MSKKELPAGTKAEQSEKDETQVTSSPNNGNTFVSSSCFPPASHTIVSDKVVSVFTNNGFVREGSNWFFKKVGRFGFKAFVMEDDINRFSFETHHNEEIIVKDIEGIIFEDEKEIELYLSRLFDYNVAINNVRFDNS